jgi:trehalose utilization protein
MQKKINVTIWNEFRHEKTNEIVKKLYPLGMHQAIADGISADDLNIRLAALDDPEHGLTEEVVNSTDVLLWWGHCHHGDVKDEIVKRVHKRVLEGMGLIVLHSGHFSKIFKALMGTNCSLKWREVGEKERIWNIEPSHPIAQGIGEYFELPHEEMYGERFDVPQDGKVIFISWFEGGEVFRSGIAFERGHGKVFYFCPGHETYPTYYDKNILKVIGNAVRWAKPMIFQEHAAPNAQPLEVIHTPNPHTVSAGIIQDVNGNAK